MFILDFLIKEYVLLVMLTGMFVITLFDVYLERRMIINLRIVLAMILTLVIADYLESYTASLETFTYWRIPLSVICYSLRPTIVMMMVFIVSPKISKIIILPAAVNLLIMSSAFFCGIAFSFDQETNHFLRGPLGYTTYIITVLYILILYYITIRSLTSRFSEEGLVSMYIAFTATLAAVLAFFQHEEVVNLTFTSDVLLYYMYCYAQYTKHDPLTGVFNRQTYQNDLKRRAKNISGIIAADLNDLKMMNDSKGHQKGDQALITITRCFLEVSTKKDRIYRIGGDEFSIICRKRTQQEMEQLLQDIKEKIAASGYSCSFGLSCGKSVEEMLRESDQLMYLDKVRFKTEQKVKGIISPR